jgi:hypothetical protein
MPFFKFFKKSSSNTQLTVQAPSGIIESATDVEGANFLRLDNLLYQATHHNLQTYGIPSGPGQTPVELTVAFLQKEVNGHTPITYLCEYIKYLGRKGRLQNNAGQSVAATQYITANGNPATEIAQVIASVQNGQLRLIA